MRSWSQRLLGVGVVLMLAVAGIIALGVIPPVQVASYPGATPDRAVRAFSVVAILNGVMAAAAVAAFRARWRPLLYLLGVLTLILGLLLIDAAAALSGHELGGATAALWGCVCFDVVGGAAVFISARISRDA